MTAFSNEERVKAGMTEVNIGRERVDKGSPAHHQKAKAIGEGPGLVLMLQEKAAGLLKALRVHPLDLASHRAEDSIEESLGQVAEAASAQQRRRFVEDIVGGDEPAARLGRPC